VRSTDRPPSACPTISQMLYPAGVQDTGRQEESVRRQEDREGRRGQSRASTHSFVHASNH
jgi:hypothetical protein